MKEQELGEDVAAKEAMVEQVRMFDGMFDGMYDGMFDGKFDGMFDGTSMALHNTDRQRRRRKFLC